MGEFLIPLLQRVFLPALYELNIVEGKGQPDFKFRFYRFHGRLCRLVRTHDEDVALRRPPRHEILRRFGSEDFFVLLLLQLHVLHHGVEVHADLGSTFQAACLHPAHLCHHLPLVTLSDRRHLKPHIRFINRNHVPHKVAQAFDYKPAIPGKGLHRAFALPTAASDYPHRGGKMQHGHNRGDMVRMAALQDLPIMRDLRLVKLPLIRLDTRPLDGKTVGGKPCLRHQPDILLIFVVMVHRV